MSDKTFSIEQIHDWKTYENVRITGSYNMFDPRARRATGLSEERYCFVMNNYSELKAQVEKEQV